MISYLLQGLGYGGAAAAQPGPFQAYVTSLALRKGWRHAIVAALAPLMTDGPIIALALLVLSRLPTGWERVLYPIGGVFVLTLARGAYRSWRDFVPTDQAEQASASAGSILRAALTNALSPGPYLFWGFVAGPILLTAWQCSPWHAAGFLAGFYGSMVAVLAGLVVLCNAARGLGFRATRAMIGISAILLTGFGVYQVWQGFA